MNHNSRGLKLAVLITVLLGSSIRVHAQHDYKVSRNLIRHEKLDEAVEVLIARMEKFPSDGEWVYQRSIALAQQGKLDESIKFLQTALRMDVPLGRVVADSHDLLEPLRKLDTFQKLLNRNGQQPTQGPMVGSVTSNSAKIWLRTARVCTVQVIAMHDGAEACRGETMTHQEGDFTGVVKLAGLRADSEYTCTFVIDGETVKLPVTCRFRTLVPNGSPTKFRFAFGGGAGFVTGHERMWQVIRDRQPDALLLLGDNMYSDDPQSSTMQKFCYYRRQSSLPYRKLVAMTTVYTIWDDHDFGTNDCSGGPDIDRPVWKIPVWNVFRQNWVNPAYGGGATQPGCWYDFQVGNIHFIMLDGRYYRHRPGKTMLGPVQKSWLKRTLLSSSAAIKVVASPVPWEYRTKGDSKDTWNGFRDERTEIFDFLAENKIDGVLLISADRHRSDAWKIDREDAYPLYEFNSSRLTNNHVHPTMKQAIFSYNKKQSFGLVELDTTPDDPKIDYSVWSIDGEKIHQLSLRYSQISETK